MSGRAATIRVLPGMFALAVGKPDVTPPPGWAWTPLTELARLESGHTPSRAHPEYWGGSIPWVGIVDARDNHARLISDTAQKITQAGLANSAARMLPAGTVCLVRTAGSIGHVTVLGREMATSQDLVNWVCGPRLDSWFLMQLFVAEKDSLRRFSRGSAHPTIYFPEVKAFHVCAPPIGEQRRIVAKLEALQARSRRAREALDAVPPLLEKLRQSILAAAFRGDLTKDWRAKHKDVEPASKLLERIRVERRKKWEEAELAKMRAKGKSPTDDRWKEKYKEPEPVDTTGLPELPKGWCWATLQELAWDAGYGTSAKCDYDGKGVAVLRIPNVARGQLDLSDIKRALSCNEEPHMLVEPGDMLIVRTNGSRDLIGRGAVALEPLSSRASFASYLIRFRILCLRGLPSWVSRYWQSPMIRVEIESHAASSAGQYNVSLGELGGCKVPIAPVEERDVILSMLDKLLARNDAAGLVVKHEHEILARLEQATLAKAFRGELVPQDPNDEPAEAMLKRLASQSPPPKKPRARA